MHYWGGWNGPRHTTEHYCHLEGACFGKELPLTLTALGGPNSDSGGPWTSILASSLI